MITWYIDIKAHHICFAGGLRCRVISAVILAAVCICVVIIVTAPIDVPLQQQYASLDRCQGVGPSSVAHVTQSGVYTIVGTFSEHNLTCFESFANVNLEPHEDRSNFNVTLYSVSQNDLEISLLHFNNTSSDSDHRFNLGMITRSRIFDDCYSQIIFDVRNYFLESNIRLDIDVSSNLSTSELFVCSFSDEDTYYSKFKTPNEIFLKGANDCRSVVLKGGERRNISEIFIADQPSFWYIGVAANVTVYVHRIWLRGVGHSISGITQNSAQPTTCTMPDESGLSQTNINRFETACKLNLSVYKPVNQNVFNDVVLVAYEKDDPRRNYFTVVNVTLKSRDFGHTVRVYTIVVATVDTSLLIFAVILTIIIILFRNPCIMSKLQKRYPTQVTEEQDQNPDREGQSADTHPSISSSRQYDQRVPGNESNSVQQGFQNLPSQDPASEPQTSKTVEDYTADPSFVTGHQVSN